MFQRNMARDTRVLVAALLLSWLTVQQQHCVLLVDAKKDRNKPHRHSGLLPPYQANSFDSVSLTRKDEEILAQGKPVMKQSLPDKGGSKKQEGPQSGGALCIQDVDAPVEAVWYQILDFNDYKSKVPNIKICQNYAVTEKKAKKEVNIKTRMVLSAMPGFSVRLFSPEELYCCITDRTSNLGVFL